MKAALAEKYRSDSCDHEMVSTANPLRTPALGTRHAQLEKKIRVVEGLADQRKRSGVDTWKAHIKSYAICEARWQTNEKRSVLLSMPLVRLRE
jgi:hypothetical protein